VIVIDVVCDLWMPTYDGGGGPPYTRLQSDVRSSSLGPIGDGCRLSEDEAATAWHLVTDVCIPSPKG
jgi:hypothetical protein